MAQDTPLNGSTGPTTGSEFGTSGSTQSRLGSTSGGNLRSSSGSPGSSSGSLGSNMAWTGSEVCPTCGHSGDQNKGLEQFLGRLGISDDMINTLKSSVQNVEVEEYLNTARDYLVNGGMKAKTFARENPGKIAAGVAVLAVGAGLLVSALHNKE